MISLWRHIDSPALPFISPAFPSIASPLPLAKATVWHGWNRESQEAAMDLTGSFRRYELEPYLGKVSRIGGKSGQGRRVLGEAMREIFDQRWRAVVTAELGFANLQEMQAFRQEELRSAAGSRKLHRSGGVGKGGGAGSSDGPPEKGGSRQ